MDQHSRKMFLPAAKVLLDTDLMPDKLSGLTLKIYPNLSDSIEIG